MKDQNPTGNIADQTSSMPQTERQRKQNSFCFQPQINDRLSLLNQHRSFPLRHAAIAQNLSNRSGELTTLFLDDSSRAPGIRDVLAELQRLERPVFWRKSGKHKIYRQCLQSSTTRQKRRAVHRVFETPIPAQHSEADLHRNSIEARQRLLSHDVRCHATNYASMPVEGFPLTNLADFVTDSCRFPTIDPQQNSANQQP